MNDTSYYHQNTKMASCLSTIHESYLVRFKADTTARQRKAHIETVQQLCHHDEEARLGIQVHPHELEELYPAYMGIFNPVIIAAIRASPEVMSACQNFALEPAAVNWSHAKATLSPHEYQRILKAREKGKWAANFGTGTRGKGAHIYIIDEGGFDSADFQKNIKRVDLTTTTKPFQENSHGTKVANVAAGDTLGLASEAFVHPYCNGLESSTIVKAFNDIIAKHKLINKNTTDATYEHGLINCSWNQDDRYRHVKYDQAIIDAIRAAQENNLIVNIAAGNESMNWDRQLLNWHTQRPFLNIVGSIDLNGYPALHTNFGATVTIFAPGENIQVWPGQPEHPGNLNSGTSYACPNVTGYFACVLMNNLGKSGQRDVSQAFRRLQSLSLIQDLYNPWNPQDPGNMVMMRLPVIGPSSTWNDLVIWPLNRILPVSQDINGRPRITGWKALGSVDDWSIRGRLEAKSGAAALNDTKVVKTIALWTFADNLEKAETDETKFQAAKDFLTTTLAFDGLWAMGAYNIKVIVGSQDMNLPSGILKKNSKAVGQFIKKAIPIARGEKVVGESRELF